MPQPGAWELTKEDEASIGKEENEVRREDQEKINRFSRLHRKEAGLEEGLKSKQKDKEDFEEVANELELADEDEKVPYKIGDSFLWLPVSEVQELLKESIDKIDEEVALVDKQLSDSRDEMEQLKVALGIPTGTKLELELQLSNTNAGSCAASKSPFMKRFQPARSDMEMCRNPYAI
ncbi:MAG: hypothetical protein Q9162_000677 [Coniocarpon cinnabarinum]